MLSRFFIDRPIFSTVLSLVIVIAGAVAMTVLPISEYPEVAPPTVVVNATYPGASADTLAKTVAAPLEEQINGVENMLYFNSSSTSNGQLSITVTFEVGTQADQAAINVNNRVQAALPRLPDEVRRNGVTVAKRSNDILLVLGLRSPNKTHDTLFLSNYATINVVDEVKRIPGVGDSNVVGARDYSMRVWLRPDRMAQLGLTTSDIAAAIRAQNNQYAAGKIGIDPAPEGQLLTYTVTAQGRMLEPEEFSNIVLRASGSHGVLRLRDVARVELGAQTYDQGSAVNGGPAVLMRVFLQSGANALNVAKAVKARMEELKAGFPDDVQYSVPFDTTRVVEASIRSVVETLLEAALLVVLVVYLFLQNWRATLIPVLAVPVSLIGTAAGLWAFGFSLNQFSLFAMVLAIGIVVDDAIVVLENVERLMREQSLSARDAAVEAMREVSGAVVAIVLVLCAVFVPVAFLGGLAGILYKQFAVTVAVAVVISGFVALTLTPALCALLLQPGDHHNRLFNPFNRAFAALTRGYTAAVKLLMRRVLLGLGLFVAVTVAVVLMFQRTPTGFVPAEDRGYLIGSILLPDAATLTRTQQFSNRFIDRVGQDPNIDVMSQFFGLDFIGGAAQTNAATMFLVLKPWDERRLTSMELAPQLSAKALGLTEGNIRVLNPPPIRGIGSTGGFEVYVQARGGGDAKQLDAVVKSLLEALRAQPRLANINSSFRIGIPQLRVEVDREKAAAAGVNLAQIFETLQATIGALYVNDFNKFGRTYRVQLQSDAPYRARPEDIGQVYVRADNGDMLPLSALVKAVPVVGPEQLERFNGFLAGKVIGGAAPGVSTGEAIRLVEEVAAATLPEGYSIAWTGQAFQEKRTGKAAVIALSFALVMVFLILAAQYERWSLPLAVLLAVPFAALGALLAVMARGMPNDIYFQIGMVVLIGLASKNAILIVEFAVQKQAEGLSVFDAALEGARMRFRPIIMTSLAFVLGVLPLVTASGAGAAARRSMGTGVFGGMLAATFIATLFIPLFFRLLTRDRRRPDTAAGDTP